MQEGMGEVEMMPWRVAAKVIVSAIVYEMHMGRYGGYGSNPSRSQSSPWACPDLYRKWHPLDALLAERRAILAGERDMLENAAKRDIAWWDEMRRG